MKTIKENKWIILMRIFIVFCLFFIQNTYMMAPDEYNYSNINGTSIRLNSFTDVFKSLCTLYKSWTGRVIVHGIIQLVLFLGQGIYKVINPIMFLTFIYLIYKIINDSKIELKKSNKSILVISIVTIILYFVRCLGEKIIWLSGSINYLWTCTAMLSIVFYYNHIILEDKNISKINRVLFLILSFLSGWSQENVVFITGSFLFIIFIFNIKKIFRLDKKNKNTIVASALLFLIGACFLMFAPGNFKRFSTSSDREIVTTIIANLGNIILNFKFSIALIILLILCFISTIVIYFRTKDNKILKELKKQLLYYILPVVIALVPMLIISEFPQRAMFPYETFIILSIISNLKIIYNKISDKSRLLLSINIILSFLIIYDFGMGLSLSQKYMKEYKDEVNLEIKLSQIEEKKDVLVSKFMYWGQINKSINSLLLNYGPIDDKSSIMNVYMASYYGFDTICALAENEYIVRIIFDNEEELKESDVIDTQTNKNVSKSFVYNKNNEIYFIIPKEKLGIYKLDLPENLKNKKYKLDVSSLSDNFECKSEQAFI